MDNNDFSTHANVIIYVHTRINEDSRALVRLDVCYSIAKR